MENLQKASKLNTQKIQIPSTSCKNDVWKIFSQLINSHLSSWQHSCSRHDGIFMIRKKVKIAKMASKSSNSTCPISTHWTVIEHRRKEKHRFRKNGKINLFVLASDIKSIAFRSNSSTKFICFRIPTGWMDVYTCKCCYWKTKKKKHQLSKHWLPSHSMRNIVINFRRNVICCHFSAHIFPVFIFYQVKLETASVLKSWKTEIHDTRWAFFTLSTWLMFVWCLAWSR